MTRQTTNLVPIGLFRPLERQVGKLQRKVDRTSRRTREINKRLTQMEADIEEILSHTATISGEEED